MLGSAKGIELLTLQQRMRVMIERLRQGDRLDGAGLHVCPSNVRLLVDPAVLAAFAEPRACPVGR